MAARLEPPQTDEPSTVFFASDNWAGAHPAIAASLSAYAGGHAAAYGNSELDRRVEKLFGDVFEREVAVFFVSTGTAANALALAALNRPGGVCFCHAHAHMLDDECGAPEFLSSGGRLRPVDGAGGRMDLGRLAQAIAAFAPGDVHGGRPVAVSITQSTEAGTLYPLDAIEAVSAVARRHGLALHMDGARFANALVGLGCSPAEMTWKRGVDVLSFGGTKNGCWCAEALVFFEPERARDFPYHRKRSAQLFSKTRFVAAQFEAYFAGGLWLESAAHANAMTAKLAEILRGSNTARLAWEPEANEIFAALPLETAQRLKAAGAAFYDWAPPAGWSGLGEGEGLFRFVTSFATTSEEVARFGQALRA